MQPINISKYPIKSQLNLIKKLKDFNHVFISANSFEEFESWLNTKVHYSADVLPELKQKFNA